MSQYSLFLRMFLQRFRDSLELKSLDHALNNGSATNSKKPKGVQITQCQGCHGI